MGKCLVLCDSVKLNLWEYQGEKFNLGLVILDPFVRLNFILYGGNKKWNF